MKRRAMRRRDFLRGAAVGAGAGILATGASASRGRPVLPSERVRLGFIGVGGRGTRLLEIFLDLAGVDVVGVCDVNEAHARRARRKAGERTETFGDFRRLLERQDIDAVVVATTGHWHCIPAIQACAAGKDVYVEKPLSISPAEGRAVVETARRHRRVAAIGTQQRSMPHYRDAVEYIRSGKLGAVHMAETFNLERAPRGGFGTPPDGTPPVGLDWDFWLGPAPAVPFNSARLAGHFFFWDTGGGWPSDWGVHHYDVVHWAMGAKGPLSVSMSGGKYHFTDCTEMPDTVEACFEYPGFLVVYRLRWSNAQSLHGLRYGNIFYGTEGTMILNRSGWRVFREGETRPVVQRPGSRGDGPHQSNFIECVRTRAAPAADIETGHRSSLPGELANLAFRLGRKLRWDPSKEEFVGDPEANRWLMRPLRAPWSIES